MDPNLVPDRIPPRLHWIWGLWSDLDGDRAYTFSGARGATPYLAMSRRLEDAGIHPRDREWVIACLRAIDRGMLDALAEENPDPYEKLQKERAEQEDTFDALREQHLARVDEKPQDQRPAVAA